MSTLRAAWQLVFMRDYEAISLANGIMPQEGLLASHAGEGVPSRPPQQYPSPAATASPCTLTILCQRLRRERNAYSATQPLVHERSTSVVVPAPRG